MEKPGEEEAEELIRQGALWNCGVFCVRIGYILNMAKEFGMTKNYEKIVQGYSSLPRISFDYQVLEKAENLVAVEFDGYWKDWNLECHGRTDEYQYRRKSSTG